MENRLFGLTYKDVRRLAFQIAETNNIPHNFNKTQGLAGEEPTSIPRAMGFNKVIVDKCFSLFNELMGTCKFSPTKIFNVDETGIITVPKKQPKAITLKRRKQVGIISSAEKGQLTTAAKHTFFRL
ncbi:hypothetical protein ILUMI_08812 [Ignelater luminosus]|uniref:Uncharacterized protein n=1 Tax=Ignelater luminosus TaxID=2038154 RepID=A0A8K0D683_IGNLU|nr:hypothetical protein ILUMI_08812 [Ignelater luminosus]